MKTLYIDIETYSETSIMDCGAYKYVMDPRFDILLVAYAIDDEPTQIIDLAQGEELPEWFLNDLMDHNVLKKAHNAAFERLCFTIYLRRLSRLRMNEFLEPAQWDCTMVKAARCGLPLSLKQVGEALHLEEQKMTEGRALIQLFCTPRKSKTDNGPFGPGPKRARPGDFPERWETFKAYCIRDVDVEREIDRTLAWYNVGAFERNLYAIDQRINDRGVLIDLPLAREAVYMDAIHSARLTAEAVKITGLSNPNSQAQLKRWLSEQLGQPVTSLTKTSVPDLMKTAEGQGKQMARKLLQIHTELAKTSNAKYAAMLEVAGPDDRARGLTQFYGTRTGRWSGRLIQMQNLPQNHLMALDEARQMLRAGDYDAMALTFGNVPDTMSQLIRTAFIAPKGKVFAVCDFSAIEARVLAWLAGEDWVLNVFRQGGDIYCATASQMFHVPVEKHGANAHLRQKGKVAVLALGYQGGVGALDKMGGARMGMTEEEEKETVQKWRAANSNIVAFWKHVENAARECILYKVSRTVEGKYMTLSFDMQENGTMTITLPSGRMICYPEAEVPTRWESAGRVNTPVINGEQKSFGVYTKEPGNALRFMGMNQVTKKWEWIETYGGKITENITQAIARDCLAETMARCEASGFPVVFHIHDELVMEVDSKEQLKDIENIFSKVPYWAEGLPLKGAGYTGRYYFKD